MQIDTLGRIGPARSRKKSFLPPLFTSGNDLKLSTEMLLVKKPHSKAAIFATLRDPTKNHHGRGRVHKVTVSAISVSWCQSLIIRLSDPDALGSQAPQSGGAGLSILQIAHVKQKTKGAVSCQWMRSNERGHASCQCAVSNYCTISPPGLRVYKSSMIYKSRCEAANPAASHLWTLHFNSVRLLL